jgi:predicted nucleic acid-binding protein
MIVVDTDVLIDALHGVEPMRTRIAEGVSTGTLATSALTVFELFAGARSTQEKVAVDALLSPLPVLPIDDGVARLAAEVERNLRGRGLRVGFADALIAAACITAGTSLLTRNVRHFGRVPGLRIEPVVA